ncbi:MAG: hypothetical protein FRX49_02534 [Trebouxia sp. A1-2]|nr:MAG: hypothetical protein FRX49_02534 [Trebouxia sp. A1-2]
MAKSPQVLICLSADASTLKAPRVAFRRQLWSEQALPDNYTDETFLRSLKISVHGPIRSYWQVVREASAVTQQMDTVVVVAMKCKAQINGPWDEAVPSIQMKQLKRHLP